jgi:hypothetical protein
LLAELRVLQGYTYYAREREDQTFQSHFQTAITTTAEVEGNRLLGTLIKMSHQGYTARQSRTLQSFQS